MSPTYTWHYNICNTYLAFHLTLWTTAINDEIARERWPGGRSRHFNNRNSCQKVNILHRTPMICHLFVDWPSSIWFTHLITAARCIKTTSLTFKIVNIFYKLWKTQYNGYGFYFYIHHWFNGNVHSFLFWKRACHGLGFAFLSGFAKDLFSENLSTHVTNSLFYPDFIT